MARAHNEHILELVHGVLAAAGIEPAGLDGVAFGCGPGSFTGIRIAASVAQAIAFGADSRILPVSSTLALATAAMESGVQADAGIVVSIRARRDAWYLAAFVSAEGRLQKHRPDCLVTADPDWPEMRNGWLLVGDRPQWAPPHWRCHADVAVNAGTIAQLGAEALAAGQGMAPEAGLPVYVSGDSPWKPAPAAPGSGSRQPV